MAHRTIFSSDAAAAAMRGEANVLDQATLGAPRAQPRQDAELEAADHVTVIVLCDHKLDMRMTVNRFERPEIFRRQRLLDPFAAAPERIVRQHPHDGFDFLAQRPADGHSGSCSHEVSDNKYLAPARQLERFFGLADPVSQRGITLEAKALLNSRSELVAEAGVHAVLRDHAILDRYKLDVFPFAAQENISPQHIFHAETGGPAGHEVV
jgi:hypothetical protein